MSVANIFYVYFIVVSLLKIMSQKQYFKIIEKEIQRVNRIIDLKILRGEEYTKEAKDHRLLLKKVRYQNRKSLLKRLFSVFFKSKIVYA